MIRRRDLHKVPYVAVSFPDYRASSGNCPRGELCEFAHGVFEYWLHPTKYRTRICNAGNNCTRSVCFFAHSLEQLRAAEPVAHLPKWVRLALRATTHTIEPLLSNTSAATHTSNTSGRREVGVIRRPRSTSNTPTPALRKLVSSISSISSSTSRVTAKERPQELKLEFLESLRMLRISMRLAGWDVSNFDWVSDLLAG